jgi:hypothetical protein
LETKKILTRLKSKFSNRDYKNEILFAITQFHQLIYDFKDDDENFEPTELIWDKIYEKYKNERLANDLVILVPIATTRVYLRDTVIKLADYISKSGENAYLSSIPIYPQIYNVIEEQLP